MQVPSRFLYRTFWTFSAFLQKHGLRAKPCGNVCNLGSWEAEAGGLQIHCQLKPHSEFQASLGYTVRPCLKTKTQTNTTPHLPSQSTSGWHVPLLSILLEALMAGTVGKASFVAWTLKSQFRAEFDRQWSLGVIAEFLEPGGKSSCDSGELRREGRG